MRSQQGALKSNLMAFVLVVIGLGVLVTTMLPPSYSADLSLIGKGKPSIVIVYESDSLSSVTLVEKMNPLRQELSESIHFLMADVNSPDGGAFQRKVGVHDGTALFYSAKGEKLFELNGPRETEVLRSIIDQTFN